LSAHDSSCLIISRLEPCPKSCTPLTFASPVFFLSSLPHITPSRHPHHRNLEPNRKRTSSSALPVCSPCSPRQDVANYYSRHHCIHSRPGPG
jgi:hypothetical protein